ncbi:chemotaxis protein MotB [Sphingomonas naasensis]|uniref:Flagellar motor protein n=1 Tax=Sphingomonas naasensis TaxID=1344951 RepID=A0A4S1W781_9SPHN|nr:flagellar motor protein MotB [Sphingomonas naasensis]NIJ21199.1 chemotaxis protein MotB [Sphingomonas naasensis]TGX38223.1 flagellar motor protein [Sphingomonas naasensis]
MAAARAPHGSNQPPKIIVKKIFVEGHGGHHGGAWKVAYADFVTAMMAFFLLLWLLGATTEKQRKALADYFAPTLIDFKQNSAGSNGLLGGDAINSRDNYPTKAAQTGTRSMTIPAGATGGNDVGTGQKGTLKDQRALTAQDQKNFSETAKAIQSKMRTHQQLAKLAKHIRFVATRDGMRIDLLDDANYSMFDLGTTALVPDASTLIGMIGESIAGMENPIMIRGHTDSLGYGDPRNMNNWMLSSGRAEATRRRLFGGGVPETRFERIEGVADREPLIVETPTDPRNRRVSITLLYRRIMDQDKGERFGRPIRQPVLAAR